MGQLYKQLGPIIIIVIILRSGPSLRAHTHTHAPKQFCQLTKDFVLTARTIKFKPKGLSKSLRGNSVGGVGTGLAAMGQSSRHSRTESDNTLRPLLLLLSIPTGLFLFKSPGVCVSVSVSITSKLRWQSKWAISPPFQKPNEEGGKRKKEP